MFHRFGSTLLRPGVDLRPTDSGRLERWLGAAAVEKLSRDNRGWYGPPIAIHGVPGAVFATGDGDFIGHCDAGQFGSCLDQAEDVLLRMRRKLAWHVARGARVRHGTLYTGFASLSDLISEASSAGKRYEYQFSKVGPTGVANVTSTLWRVGNQPAAGGAPAAAPGGTAFVDSTTGGHVFTNPNSPDTQHIVQGMGISTLTGSLLLFDQIFGVVKTMASTATEAVTGVPTRYQNTTGGTADFAGGNFVMVTVGGTALAATGHNWTVCQYTDQAGNTANSFPSMAGNASAIVDRLDHPVNSWYMPLASGDVGVQKLTQMQCDASVATGVIWFMMGHPIAWMPFPLANIVIPMDYIQTAFNLTRIFDDACLVLLDVNKPAATASTYNVQFSAVAG